jgi:Protein of unknown function (DUF3617)
MNRFLFSRLVRNTLLLAMSTLSAAAFAIDGIPLDQLRPGLWKVERKIEKLDLNPVEHETRNTEYCASPKKELSRTMNVASFLCKTSITSLADNKFQMQARCNLPGISGTNTTIITIVSADEYTASVDTIGTKFGEKQHRKEHISAIRAGDCKE